MVKILGLIFSLFLISCSNIKLRQSKYLAENKLFNIDSACLKAQDLFPFLVGQKLIKAKDTINTVFNASDTIGKFYRSGNEITLCFEEFNTKLFEFETHVIAEFIVNEKGKAKFKSKTRYFHGNYPCCWNNFDGFIKKGDYFFIKTCGTGSGFCAGQWRIYAKNRKNNPQAEGFLFEMSACMDSDTCYGFHSTFDVINTNIFVEYEEYNFVFDTLTEKAAIFNDRKFKAQYKIINGKLDYSDTMFEFLRRNI
ncbi:MAG: hypothetical protein ACK5B9_09465 [Flavobacteriia bacterium]